MKFEHTIRILETQLWFEKGLIDVISDPYIQELKQAIKILESEDNDE